MYSTKLLGIILPTLLLGGGILLTGCNSTPSSTSPSQAQQTTGDYSVKADLPDQGLKVQQETYTLRVTDKSGQPVSGISAVQVTMPMDGGSPMIAPTTLKPGSTPGTYTIKTEFTMAGTWTLHLKPTLTAEPLTIALPVSES